MNKSQMETLVQAIGRSVKTSLPEDADLPFALVVWDGDGEAYVASNRPQDFLLPQIRLLADDLDFTLRSDPSHRWPY